MSNVIIGLIGVILAISLALASAIYFGDQFQEGKVEVEAMSYLNDVGQISRAAQQYASEKGKAPIEAGREPIEILVSEKYMKNGSLADSTWTLQGRALLRDVPGDLARANKICAIARAKAKMPTPNNILKCDGSNAPGGVLSPRDPCCLR
ncbi:hypothetical protein [Sphingosinicella sp. BN140058]|uniref:hypothetical protein n=1 Tax=Sphingosinicella sp. BN140058 TaxID=1892855 RepID=UPI001010212E|nr:hypothetical protein [Sphingosinicella sp. BN140058]QAY80146.1 hypothetical protein ETR14_26245 [Sphingosinicella sp. BN140058]